MQHTFASSGGPIEVTLSRDGEALVLEGQSLVQHNRGRLHLRLRDGTTCLAHAAKVGDVWWVHLNGRTYKWERVEPGSSGAEDEGGLVAPMPGKVLEVLVSQRGRGRGRYATDGSGSDENGTSHRCGCRRDRGGCSLRGWRSGRSGRRALGFGVDELL